MLQTSLLTDRKFLGYNNICVAEIRDNAASGCGSAWLEHLVWDQGVAGSNPVTPMYARVWFNGRTSAFQAENVGSIPITRSCVFVAQLDRATAF